MSEIPVLQIRGLNYWSGHLVNFQSSYMSIKLDFIVIICSLMIHTSQKHIRRQLNSFNIGILFPYFENSHE